MRYLVYKSTDLLDAILSGHEASCRYVRLTEHHLRSRRFNFLLRQARSSHRFFPTLLTMLPGFSPLRSVGRDDVVIVFDMADLTFTDYLSRCLPASCRRHAFFWNPLSKLFADTQAATAALAAQGYELSTFDHSDARDYHLAFKHQFVRNLNPSPCPTLYDYYFLGAPKGREALLSHITSRLNSLGLQGRCIMPRTKAQQISYRDNIVNVVSSRCLIEIVQEGQADITLRALEALVYGRKLITTCTGVVNYDFYHPQNILLWADQDDDHLRRFLSSPVVPVAPHIVKAYSTKAWLSSFS